MQKVEDAKTALALKSLLSILLVIFIIFVAFFRQQPILKINHSEYYLDQAKQLSVQEKGLGGKSSLASNKGMLYTFNQPGKQCFWMKDMKFSLDIIWLTSDKQVDYISQNVSPQAYPDIYCTNIASKYVIEMNAGTVEKESIHSGQYLHF